MSKEGCARCTGGWGLTTARGGWVHQVGGRGRVPSPAPHCPSTRHSTHLEVAPGAALLPWRDVENLPQPLGIDGALAAPAVALRPRVVAHPHCGQGRDRQGSRQGRHMQAGEQASGRGWGQQAGLMIPAASARYCSASPSPLPITCCVCCTAALSPPASPPPPHQWWWCTGCMGTARRQT